MAVQITSKKMSFGTKMPVRNVSLYKPPVRKCHSVQKYQAENVIQYKDTVKK
jgi:hypothetical protein